MALKSPQPVPSLWLSENKASQDLFSPLVGMLASAQPSSSALRIRKTYLLTVLHEGEKCIYGCLVVAQNDKSSPNSVVPNGTILKRLIKNRRFGTWGRPL